jgi:DNA-binding MurR/RpiR family transcriptional regulator
MGFSGLAKKRAGQQTAHITGMCSAIHDHSAAMAPDALPIAISVPPHAGETVAVAAAARVKGQRVLAIARPTVGPITEGAAEVLTVDDAEPHGCRSLTALLTRVMGIACRERRERGDFSNDFINV